MASGLNLGERNNIPDVMIFEDSSGSEVRDRNESDKK